MHSTLGLVPPEPPHCGSFARPHRPGLCACSFVEEAMPMRIRVGTLLERFSPAAPRFCSCVSGVYHQKRVAAILRRGSSNSRCSVHRLSSSVSVTWNPPTRWLSLGLVFVRTFLALPLPPLCPLPGICSIPLLPPPPFPLLPSPRRCSAPFVLLGSSPFTHTGEKTKKNGRHDRSMTMT